MTTHPRLIEVLGEMQANLDSGPLSLAPNLLQRWVSQLREAANGAAPPAKQLDPAMLPHPLKLDIGAGDQPRGEDFTTVDKFMPADIPADMDKIPLPDNCVDEIWSAHTLEHAAVKQVHGILKEWLRLLKPGARAIVQVPNFDYVARYWLCGNQGQRDSVWAEQMIFGQQFHEGEFHRTAYTAISIKADLEAAGFIVDRVVFLWNHNQETLQAVARKPVPEAAVD